jgi:lipoprotein-releasing system ATP-binding protein
MINALDIWKTYNTSQEIKLDVLKSVSIDIPEKKISVIVGASGAGKSTLLHILGGLDKPSLGTVKIDGINLNNLSDNKLSSFLNKNIGFIFQFHHLLPEFSALENVCIPIMIAGNSFSTSKKRALELLNLVSLTERKNHKPSELSGGEQQRIAVARALANNPKLILADEPTGNLDSSNSEILHQIFVELRDKYKKTLVIVTHNKELMKLADCIFEMRDGRIIRSEP